MVTVRYGFFRSDDGIQLRYGLWPHDGDSNNGTVIVLGGRAEFMEKYIETIQRITARGFTVFSLDWRGQGLSQRLLKDSTRGYIQSYDQYVTDLVSFFRSVIPCDRHRPVIVLAHSMGALILLLFLQKYKKYVDKGILLSPLIDIHSSYSTKVFARIICNLLHFMKKGEWNIPSIQHSYNFHLPFEKNCLTHDKNRFEAIRQMLAENPRLSVRNVTFGWLKATFNAIDTLRHSIAAESVTTPLLIVVAGDDSVVCNDAIRQFVARLPDQQTIKIDRAFHEILQEQDYLQAKFWTAFDRFVVVHNG